MNKLRHVLRFNALTCVLFGLAFVAWPQPIASALGDVPAGLLLGIGAVLLGNGCHLVIGYRRANLVPVEILYFAVGDILWFMASLTLVGANQWITTVVGQIVTMVVASTVLGIGLAQLWLLAEATHSGVPFERSADIHDSDLLPSSFSRLRAIGASWMAMKTWVKLWLFALNGLFLTAIAFLPDTGARIVLAAYVATGPLLAAIMIWQRGLTRLLGVAHLVPWLPLVSYLVLHILDLVGDPISKELGAYLSILVFATTICVIMDVFDSWRWLQGETFRLGSKNSAAMGASRRAQSAGSSEVRQSTVTRQRENDAVR